MSERPTPDLEIVETRVYRGANVWSYDKSIHLVVDLGSLEQFPTNTIPGFTDDLVAMLPGLREHSCSRGRRGGFLERLNEGTWLGHVAEHVALALQQLVGHDIRRGKTRQVKGQPGRYNIIYGYIDENVGLTAGPPRRPAGQPPRRGRPRLRLGDRARRLHPSRRAHRLRPLDAGDRRRGGLPRHPVDPAQPVLPRPARPGRPRQADPRHDDLGDSSIAVDIASDKDLTTKLLGAAGLPVPKQESVRTEEGAVAAARRIGYPVVLKPLDGNHGRGVCLDLQDEADVRAAFPIAEGQSRRGNVIVESFVTGKDYRCLIIDGRMVAIAERVPASRDRRRHVDRASSWST